MTVADLIDNIAEGEQQRVRIPTGVFSELTYRMEVVMDSNPTDGQKRLNAKFAHRMVLDPEEFKALLAELDEALDIIKDRVGSEPAEEKKLSKKMIRQLEHMIRKYS